MDDNNLQQFVAGQEITMKMTLTPEQVAMFKEWSAMVPTLYLLDICVVGATKLSEETLERRPRKAKLISTLRDLDRPNNCVSYLCALMEKVSDSRGLLNLDELKTQILADISSLRSFFKSARIVENDDFLIGFLEELMGRSIENKRAEFLKFLEILNNDFKLQNPISPAKRLCKAKEIVQKASDLSISIQHPIVTISLACLYGNVAAKKLMKFKADPNKFDSENALADVLLISRFAKLKLEIEHHGRNGAPYKRVHFITDDNGLSELVKNFKPRYVKHKDKFDGRETELSMTVELEKLLIEATPEDYEAITNLLLQEEPHS
ncbi:TPA: hypothetical protein ACPJ0D_004706 [Vibrio diabolicus]